MDVIEVHFSVPKELDISTVVDMLYVELNKQHKLISMTHIGTIAEQAQKLSATKTKLYVERMIAFRISQCQNLI